MIVHCDTIMNEPPCRWCSAIVNRANEYREMVVEQAKGRTTHELRHTRPLFSEEPDVESGRYGCPMLMRARQIYTRGVELPTHRCELGWAIHGEPDIERCMAVESAVECWKGASERALIPFSAPPGPGPRQHQTKASAD